MGEKNILGNWHRETADVDLLHEQIMSSLVSRVYDYVILIDINEKNMFVDYDNTGVKWEWTKEFHQYSEARHKMARHYIFSEDKEEYLNNSDVLLIKNKLAKSDEYMFTCRLVDEQGDIHNKLFHHYYLNREKGYVIATMEDKTSLLGRDTLTGEYNHRGFIEAAQQLIRDEQRKEEFAILYINLRGFKAVNDVFGSDGGDRALRRVCRALKRSELRPLLVGRVNADHFACLVDRRCIREDILTNLLHQTYVVNNRSMELFGICGIYLIGADERAGDVGHMCDGARMALHYIEDEYVKPFIYFDEKMRKKYRERTDTLSELKNAMDNGEFKVFYQPVYNVKTKRVASAEALIRWERSNGEMVSPGAFVPVLEDSGRISQMDLFVERSVISFLEERHREGKHIVPVSINMSRMDFYDKKMITAVLQDISNTTVPIDYTRFEVTETAYSSVAETNKSALEEFKNIGIKFYLDDFGSGYSSFSTLRDYDFDVVKLDRGFIQKIGTASKANGIIRSIIEMTHSIGAQVVAEGAETEEQVEFLTTCGCDFIQGFFFSKPLCMEDFEKLLDARA